MLLKTFVFIAILGICQAEHAFSSQSIVVHHEYKGQHHNHEHKHEHANEHHHELKHELEHKYEHATSVKPLVHVEKKAELKKVEAVTLKKEEHVEVKKVEEITKKPESVAAKKLKSVVHHEISHVHKHEHHVPEKVAGPIVTQKADLVAHYIVKGTEHEHNDEHRNEQKHESKEEHKHDHNEGHKYEHKVEHKHEHNYRHKEEPKQEHNHDDKNEHKQDHIDEHKHEHYAHAYSSQHIIRHDVPAPPPKEHYEHHAPAKYEYNVHNPHHHQESQEDHDSVKYTADKKTGYQTDIKHTIKHVEDTKKH